MPKPAPVTYISCLICRAMNSKGRRLFCEVALFAFLKEVIERREENLSKTEQSARKTSARNQ